MEDEQEQLPVEVEAALEVELRHEDICVLQEGSVFQGGFDEAKSPRDFCRYSVEPRCPLLAPCRRGVALAASFIDSGQRTRPQTVASGMRIKTIASVARGFSSRFRQTALCVQASEEADTR